MRYALPEESSGIGTAHAELTIAWPKHGYASRAHATFLHASPRAAARSDSLHVPRPTQSPRVDEPHLASIASTHPAVSGSARECVAQVVRYGAGVADGNYRKFAEDALNGNDVQDRFLVVKLINYPRADRFQPSCTEEHAIMSIIATTFISVIMANYNYNMYNMYNCYNVYNYHYQDHRRFP
jgi:hypothetical protein